MMPSTGPPRAIPGTRADPKVDVCVAQINEGLLGFLPQLLANLDRVDILHQSRENRRLISRSGPIEDPLIAIQL